MKLSKIMLLSFEYKHGKIQVIENAVINLSLPV